MCRLNRPFYPIYSDLIIRLRKLGDQETDMQRQCCIVLLQMKARDEMPEGCVKARNSCRRRRPSMPAVMSASKSWGKCRRDFDVPIGDPGRAGEQIGQAGA